MLPALPPDGDIVSRPTGRIIYLAGFDGTGKTTQAELVLEALRRDGVPARYLWLRFPQYTSLPVLAFSRLVRVTRYRVVAGKRVGQWEFERMRWLAKLLLWCQVLDARVARIRRIDPLVRRGEVVVLDRFVYDIVVDIASAAADPGLLTSRAARLLCRVIDPACAVILDAPVEVVRIRRPDLAFDEGLMLRSTLYRQLATQLGVRTIETSQSPECVRDAVLVGDPTSGSVEANA